MQAALLKLLPYLTTLKKIPLSAFLIAFILYQNFTTISIIVPTIPSIEKSLTQANEQLANSRMVISGLADNAREISERLEITQVRLQEERVISEGNIRRILANTQNYTSDEALDYLRESIEGELSW